MAHKNHIQTYVLSMTLWFYVVKISNLGDYNLKQTNHGNSA